ncbi:sensor histidine kinase [Bradyrhizobium sp. DASA03076]|uniref:sensor histidine kinase n=1 Tax=Bradyrhizobium sp. BLXBL-03 TaxID=3395916 RepID=UPI003F718E00
MFGTFGMIHVVLVSGMMASILHHDEHQRFLFGELRHRSRNLFAVVQGMASRTLMESASVGAARQALETRLRSLARTHGMLADSGWTGAPLDQIVSEELMSFANQFDCAGCDLILDTPAAQSFALIIHELATNAVKHGALSQPAGRVAIKGSILQDEKGELFRFVWTESGGPAVSAPRRKGFGSSILDTMANRFACRVEAAFRCRCRFTRCWHGCNLVTGANSGRR